MTEFVTRAPENLSIAVAARTFPPRRLSRLRATGQVEEIGPDDLALTFEEVQEYMRASTEVTLDPRDIDTLRERTEGWAAGLQMVTIALRGKRNVGQSDRVVQRRGAHGQRLPAGGSLRHACPRRFAVSSCAPRSSTGSAPTSAQWSPACRTPPSSSPKSSGANCSSCRSTTSAAGTAITTCSSDFLTAELNRRHPEELPGLHARASEWFANRVSGARPCITPSRPATMNMPSMSPTAAP